MVATGRRSEIEEIDENAEPNERFCGHPVLRAPRDGIPAGWSVFPASGDCGARRDQLVEAKRRRWNLCSLLAPTATVGAGAGIGIGSVVAHHAHVGPLVRIGDGCIVNTAAVVEHDCEVGEFTHVSVNSTIAGGSTVGGDCFIGAGATVIDGISICNGVTVGAGSVVVSPISEPGIYAGCPAKRLR